MDGNGRWAEQRGLPRVAGHQAGADSVREIVRAAGSLGVEVLTLYSFSTENWGRPEDEVQALMALLERYLRDELAELTENRVRLSAIGQLDRLPATVREALRQVSAYTAGHDGLHLVLALSYGSRLEIVDAIRELARDVASGRIDPEAIDEAAVSARLWTRGLPDPDLLIRTSGEMRLSNFLLWQVAYSELYVTDVPWPDFRRPQLEEAFLTFGRRQRRFGKTGAQVVGDSAC
jgi:undecaprenyl diphosphate synthase